ncbi:MAG: DUF91 domain-containing protein [Oscillospiraceae bacterium]|nr:DUF91 domain-containing protein [Oscillospiraceae bacterium]MBR4655966.1 DUF91 domain-containing protein [Oscillospiraceae bacterium]
MALTQSVWSLDDKKPLDTARLIDEKELETLLCDHIELLNNGWLVIGNQVKTDAGKYIDILCMDHSGCMIVVELKKDLTPREVTAQVIDYAASVTKLTPSDIAQLYLDYTHGKTLNASYQEKFGKELDETSVNNDSVKMVIVAAKMDDGTERIIHFLKETYKMPINVLFFYVFQNGTQRFISRVWLEDEIDEPAKVETGNKGPWNGEYYVSFGEDSRNWEDARKYGFISAGGGSWYSQTLNLLSSGDRIWVNIPHNGYVGVGIVTSESVLAKDAVFFENGVSVKMNELPLKGKYFYSPDDSEKAEYIVQVRWIKTVRRADAVRELGFFGNQNSVCRPTAERWSFTVERLKKLWNIE